MSMYDGPIKGVGFCLKDVPGERIRQFIVKHMNSIDKRTVAEILFYPELNSEDERFEFIESKVNGECGIGGLISDVMAEETGITIQYFNIGGGLIVFTPEYPWYLNTKERTLTYSDLRDLFKKYMLELGLEYEPYDVSLSA